MAKKPSTFWQFYLSAAGCMMHLFFGALSLLLLRDWLAGNGPIHDPAMLAFSFAAPPICIFCKWIVLLTNQKQIAENRAKAIGGTPDQQRERVRKRSIILGLMTITGLGFIFSSQQRWFGNGIQLAVPGYALLIVVTAGLLKINIWNKSFELNPDYDSDFDQTNAG